MRSGRAVRPPAPGGTVKPILHVKGPADAGPGDRSEVLDRARRLLEQSGIGPADTVRIDVPGKGAEEGGEDGALRPAVEPIVPALQSGSLFGDRQGVQVIDAQWLQSGEAEIIAELLEQADPETVTVVFVTAGALPARLARTVREQGEVVSVKKLRERDGAEWLAGQMRARKLDLAPDAVAALLQRFGSDVAAMGQALDQLASIGGKLSGAQVLSRFANRPDEPMWHYADAVADGDVASALRRLSDFLAHGHPLQLLAFLESDLRRRALASAAPNLETLADWLNSPADSFPLQKAWRRRKAVSDSELQRALSALTRADNLLKTAPEEIHRVTMERLTVALCLWYGGKARRAG